MQKYSVQIEELQFLNEIFLWLNAKLSLSGNVAVQYIGEKSPITRMTWQTFLEISNANTVLFYMQSLSPDFQEGYRDAYSENYNIELQGNGC